MKLYSYVVASDTGFAPNPFWGYLTLATCKPSIRKRAEKGGWVIGTGSTKNVGHGRLIYAMRITEPPLRFQEYNEDRRFQKKKPKKHTDLRYTRGDNIYYRDQKGVWKQRPSRHNEKHMERDLGGKRVLISRCYWYFGRNAPKIPKRFRDLVFTGRNYKCNFSEKLGLNFVAWLEKNYRKGIHGDPCQDWNVPKEIGSRCK